MTLCILLLSAMPLSEADSPEAEYVAAREVAAADKAGHLQLARLARRFGMDDRYAAHMLVVADLEEDPAEAATIRERLGQRRVAGEWVDAAAVRRLEQIDKDRRKLAGRYHATVLRARQRAAAGDGNAARRLLGPIGGPHAAWLIGKAFAGAGAVAESLAVEVVDGRRGMAASQALAEFAVESDWPAVRSAALAALTRRDLNDFVPVWMGKLHTPLTVRSDEQVGGRGGAMSVVYESESWNVRKRLKSQTVAVYRPGPAEFIDAVPTRGTLSPLDGLLTGVRSNRTRESVAEGRLASAMARAKLQQTLRQREFERDVERTNDRVFEALEAVDGQTLSTPDEAWDWWASHQGIRASAGTDEKELIEVSEYEQEVVSVPSRLTFRPAGECFAAGTSVLTPGGPRAIETLTIGDRVVSQDVVTGRMSEAVVLRPTRRMAREHYEMYVDGERLLASGGHPVWEAGHGWRRVRHADAGRDLWTMGGPKQLTRVAKLSEDDPRSQEPVYNLIVDGTHTYFVGDARLLVHDDTIPRPVDQTVPGIVAD